MTTARARSLWPVVHKEIRSLGPLWLVAVAGLAGASALGSPRTAGIGGPFYAMIMVALGAVSIGFGAAAIVVLPIFYGVIGAIGGLVTAFLYNLVAGVVGGIEIDVESRPGAAGI